MKLAITDELGKMVWSVGGITSIQGEEGKKWELGAYKNKSYCNSELGKEKETEMEAGGDLPRLEVGWDLGRGSH